MPRQNSKYGSLSHPPPKKNWLLRFVFATLLLLAATCGLGYYAWKLRAEHGNSLTRTADCTTELATTKFTVDRLTQKLEKCARLSAATSAQAEDLATLSDNLDASKAELTELRKQRAEAANRLAAFRELSEKFRKMIDSGKLDVVVRNGRMMVKMPSSVLFPSGSAELSRDGELALMEVAVVLRQFPKRNFMVTGHTDNRPLENAANKSKYASNWELSTARAVTVTKFLVEARLNPQNLLAAGHAEYDPVGDNTTKNGRQTNRRIEISLLPNIEELPAMPSEKQSQKENEK